MIRRVLAAAGALVALAILARQAGAAVPTPGAAQTAPVAIVGATLHPVDGPDVPNGTIVLEGGRIVALGPRDKIVVPANAVVVEANGKHVYPSLIDPWSTLGLTEVEANRAQQDYAEKAPVAPNVRADQAFQPESELIPVTRSNGVLVANVTPRGTLLAGQAAVMALDGWTNTDMTIKAPSGLVVTWPNMLLVRGEGAPPDVVQRENRGKALKELARVFDEADAYRTARRAAGAGAGPAPPHDLRWDAVLPVLEGKEPLLVQADEVHQIEAAVAFADARRLKLVIFGGYDAPLVAPLLKARDVPVIVSAVDRLPRRRSDPYDAAYSVAGQLAAAGVRVAIANGGGAWNERNLPYQAARAVGFGLAPDVALRAITLTVAEILGVSDRLGSLAPGKDATLFVSDGDPLDESSHVERAWIAGREVDLDDKQKVLDRKYREKYRRLHVAATATAGATGGTIK